MEERQERRRRGAKDVKRRWVREAATRGEQVSRRDGRGRRREERDQELRPCSS
jgi:hypothetical protein